MVIMSLPTVLEDVEEKIEEVEPRVQTGQVDPDELNELEARKRKLKEKNDNEVEERFEREIQGSDAEFVENFPQGQAGNYKLELGNQVIRFKNQKSRLVGCVYENRDISPKEIEVVSSALKWEYSGPDDILQQMGLDYDMERIGFRESLESMSRGEAPVGNLVDDSEFDEILADLDEIESEPVKGIKSSNGDFVDAPYEHLHSEGIDPNEVEVNHDLSKLDAESQLALRAMYHANQIMDETGYTDFVLYGDGRGHNYHHVSNIVGIAKERPDGSPPYRVKF